jgi:hypothetical protein
MTDISPAAQAVLDAAYREMDYAPRRHVQWVTAAALRAAADQLITVDWSVEMEELHDSFHAIANELEAQ